MRKHTTMSIPKALYESVKEIIDFVPELGYTTPAEFCKDAIRRRISSIKKEHELGKDDVAYIIAEITKTMKSNEDYKSILDSLNCGTAVFSNPDGVLITSNRKFREILGCSRDDVTGKRFSDFIIPEDVPRVKKSFEAKMEGKDIENGCMVRAVGGDGGIISIEVGCGLYRVGNDIKGVCVLVRKVDKE
ncbi:MAG: PAS domain-containing protein [Candidatus Methanofastidiosia archaeon]